MGAGLAKNKLSPEPKRTPRQGVISVTPNSFITTQQHHPRHPSQYHDRENHEDEALEKIANNYMRGGAKPFHHGGTTYAGLDLRLEVDSPDNPAMEEVESSYDEEGSSHEEYETDTDDGYYNSAEKVLYEKPKPKPDNTQFIVNWKKGTLLGSGGFGKVYLGLDNETGAMFAVKEISLGGDSYQQSKELKSFKQEVALMKNLRHENIVQYLGTMEEANELNIFLEYVPGGSIAMILSKFGSFSEPLVKRYTRQILSGLEYLHSHHIIHRDIKGANILVDNCGIVKLADFGASKKMEALMTTTGGYNSLKGTPYWMAPEVIKQSGYGRQADIWSVGCTVIEMATGKPPFHEFTDQVSVLFHIATSNSPPPIPSHLSPVAQDFLLKCFERNPRHRPNARALLDHPFLKEDGRKSSANSGFSSPKVSHSFNSPRNKDQPQPVFAKPEEPRQPSPLIQGSPHMQQHTALQRPPPNALSLQNDDDNLIEEPTWSWGGGNDKRKMNNFVEKFSSAELPNPANFAQPKREINVSFGKHSGGIVLAEREEGEVRRHKRAISVTPEKMIPSNPLPQDSNAPPPARLSMRRHSALESSIREASEYFKIKEAQSAAALASNQHSNGLCSSPSTPGRSSSSSSSNPRGEVENNLFNNMANFNNSFNQTFNSINNTNYLPSISSASSHGHPPSRKNSATSVINNPHNINNNIANLNINVHNNNNNNNNNINVPPSPVSSSAGKRFSPGTPRREVVDEEEDINKFLKTTSNDLMQSTRDLSKFKQASDPNKRILQTIDKLPQERERKLPQLSPKKFSDGVMNDNYEEAFNAKFKKKQPGTTTTTIVLNNINSSTNGLDRSNNNSNNALNNSGSITNPNINNINPLNMSGGIIRESRDGLTRSNGGVRNAW